MSTLCCLRTFWIVFVLILAGIWPIQTVMAENLLNLISGDGSVDSEQQQKGIVPLEEVKSRLDKLIQDIAEEKKQNYQETLAKQIKSLQEIMIEYQSFPKKREFRRIKEIRTTRLAIVKEAKSFAEVLLKLQTAYSSLEQNRINLQATLNSYTQARKSMEQLIQQKFPIQRRSQLKDVVQKVKSKRKKLLEDEKKIGFNLLKLNKEITDNQQAMDQARQQMLAEPEPQTPKEEKPKVEPPKPEVRPEPKRTRNPRNRRGRRGRQRAKTQPQTEEPKEPSPAELKKIQLQQELESEQERLVSLARRLKFDRFRYMSQYLDIRKRDELLQKEVTQFQIHLHTYTLTLMEDVLTSYDNQAEGGIFYHKPLPFSWAMFRDGVQHTTKLVEISSKEALGLGAWLWQQLERSRKRSGNFQFIINLSLPILLFILAFFVRRMFNRGIRQITAKIQSDDLAPQLWKILLMFADMGRSLLLYAALLVGFILALQFVELPDAWTQLVIRISLIIVTLRATFILAEYAFSDHPEKRWVYLFDDSLTRSFRRTVKWLTGLAVFYIPSLEILETLRYSPALIDFLWVVFYGILWLGAVISYLTRKPVSVPVAAPVPEGTTSNPGKPEGDVSLSQQSEASSPTQGQDLSRAMPPQASNISADAINSPKKSSDWSHLLGYYLYPLLLWLSTAIFVIYLWGYHNFSGYLLRAVLLSLLCSNFAYGLFNMLSNLTHRAVGLNARKTAWFRIEPKRAIQIHRVAKMVWAVLLFTLCVGLLLEIWQVPGGYRAIGKFVNYPILDIQKTRLSVWSLLQFILAITFAVWFSRFLQEKLKQTLYPVLRLKEGTQHAINTTLGYTIVILGVLGGLQLMGMSIGVLAVFAGVIGIGVGFGMQNVADNFISGLIITFGRPISVGDVIEVGDIYGIVRQISARSTTVETIDSRVILIPNSDILTHHVINWSLGPPYVWVQVSVGVSYRSDIQQVTDALLELSHQHPLILQNPKPYVQFEDFGEYALQFHLKIAMSNPMEKERVLSDLRYKINQTFRELGIEIPFQIPEPTGSSVE